MKTIGNGLWSGIKSDINENFTDIDASLGSAATLDGSGQLTSSQIPSSLLSGLSYEGDLDIDSETTLDMSQCTTGCFFKMQSSSAASGVTIKVTWDNGGSSTETDVITNDKDWIVLSASGPSDWGISENPATSTSQGVLKLAGDLGGTASEPEVQSVGGEDPFARVNHTGSQAISTITDLQDNLDGINEKLALPQTDTDEFLSGNSNSPQKICDLPGLEEDFQLEWDISSGGNSANVEIRKKRADGVYLAVARWSQVSDTSSTNSNVLTDNNSASGRVMDTANTLLRISHHISFANQLACEIIELFVVPNDASASSAHKYEILALRKPGDNNGRAYVRRIA